MTNTEKLKQEFNVQEKPEEGNLKVETYFAWWPKRINGKLIWLREYQYLMEYRTRHRFVPLYGYGSIQGTFGGWDTIGEKVVEKRRGVPEMPNPPDMPNDTFHHRV